MPQTRSNKGQGPINSDIYNLTADLATLIDSLEVIVPVADSTEGDAVATARTAAGWAVSDARPLFVWNATTKALEIKVTSGWRGVGQRTRFMHFRAAAFAISGGSVNWDVGPLVAVAGDTINGGFASQNATSGTLTIGETGWYSISSLTMPNGSPGNVLVSLLRNGSQVIFEVGGTGVNWGQSVIVPRFAFTAGDTLLWRLQFATARSADTDVWISRLDN
jgi:hypothetical protein